MYQQYLNQIFTNIGVGMAKSLDRTQIGLGYKELMLIVFFTMC